ncbi:hypothetical protein MMC07_003827 [Pseudocyphellaria aurata]|nr:hypothetical protein [Pseudocyphellaria aurata]
MNVLQTVLLSLLGLLCFPSATALIHDGQRGERTNRWDLFSTLSCSCSDWQNADNSDHHGHHSGDYFGISYYNRDSDRLYNWTALEVRNPARPGPHHAHRERYLQPKMHSKCVWPDDGTMLCYWRYRDQTHGRYMFERHVRELPDNAIDVHSANYECRTICPEVVKLPLVSATSCHRVHYQMRMICPGHHDGECPHPHHE